MSQPNPTPNAPLHPWWDEAISLYKAKAAHAFCVTGNVYDYVTDATGEPMAQDAAGFIAVNLAAANRIVVCFDIARGFSFPLDDGKGEKRFRSIATGSDDTSMELPRDAGSATEMVSLFMRQEPTAAVIIDAAAYAFPKTSLELMPAPQRATLLGIVKAGSDNAIASNYSNGDGPKRRPLIFMIASSRTELPTDLFTAAGRWHSVSIPLPDRTTRQSFIEARFPDSPLPASEVANATGGLTLYNIEDAFLLGRLRGGITSGMIRDYKADLFRQQYEGRIEIMDADTGFETVGGFPTFKRRAKDVLIPALRNGDAESVVSLVLAGAAGTGKTLLARSLAGEAGILALEWKLAASGDKYAGEGERKVLQDMAALRAFAPAVVFVDELDQTMKRDTTGTDSQGSHIFNLVLQFMQEMRGKLLFIGATNRPDLIDPALMRPGRFDVIVPVPLPGPEARRQIMAVSLARSTGKPVKASSIPHAAVNMTEGWTGAELDLLARKAREIGTKDLDAAFTQAAARLRKNTKQAAQWTDLALASANDADWVEDELLDRWKALDADSVRNAIKAATATPRTSIPQADL